MKKSNNIISDWLDKYGDPEIEKQVKKEIEHINKIMKTLKEIVEKLKKHITKHDDISIHEHIGDNETYEYYSHIDWMIGDDYYGLIFKQKKGSNPRVDIPHTIDSRSALVLILMLKKIEPNINIQYAIHDFAMVDGKVKVIFNYKTI